MPIFKRIAPAIGFVFLVYSTAAFSIIRTVAKSGADFATISAAVSASAPGDVIVIADAGTYEEQVTIDSSKSPLTLTSNNPTSLIKPTIRYRDTMNVGPRTYAESQDVSKLTYDRNAALRLLKVRNVIIDGIAVDGGGPFAFGYNAIWDRQNALQFGNSAIAVWGSGGVIVRNCDIANSYFGISFKDRNVGGIFANPNSADLDTSSIIPMSRYGLMGNHLIERNRIHGNSFGIFSESSWDLGSTIRYNLIYENHHPTEAFATRVRTLTDDGIYQVGGAFMFKDIQLSPFAIYNNTFWHNFLIFSGHWQAGYQHLVFNNIFGAPHKYLGSADGILELTPSLTNRICNSIFSAQIKAPAPPVAYIIGNLHVTLVPDSGAGKLIEGFPAAANNRWLEMDSSKFLSIDPASANFLEPNWLDSGVQNFIKQKGWQESGIKNTDGSWADLGAIEQAHGAPSFTGTINPVPSPVTISGATAQITFALDERIGAMKNPVIKLFRLVKTKFISGSLGCCWDSLIIAPGDMSELTVPAAPPVQVGPNMYTITCPAVSGYAFIEMIVEATGADGKQFTLATGFLPYRNLNYKLVVEIHDKNGSAALLSEVHVGDTAQLRLLPQKMDGASFWSPLKKVSVMLSSGFDLLVPGNPATQLAYPNGLAGGPDSKLVIFTGVPASGIDYISAGAEWKETSESAPLPFVGGASIKVLPRSIPTGEAANPSVSLHNGIPQSEVIVKCFDLQGRRIFQKTFLIDNNLPLISRNARRLSPGLAGKAYVLDISVKDALSLKRMRSVREIVVR
jgi:hypothetical protein